MLASMSSTHFQTAVRMCGLLVLGNTDVIFGTTFVPALPR